MVELAIREAYLGFNVENQWKQNDITMEAN